MRKRKRSISRPTVSERSSMYYSASASSSPSRMSSLLRGDSGGGGGGGTTRASGGRVNLFRSRSEGNLAAATAAGKKQQQQQGLGNLIATPLDRCIRAIYGSWRNLMQRKLPPPYSLSFFLPCIPYVRECIKSGFGYIEVQPRRLSRRKWGKGAVLFRDSL